MAGNEISKILYRKGTKQDIAGMVSLMNSQYSRKKDGHYFIWQFFKSVYPTTLIVALADNKIVGMLGLQLRILTNLARIGQIIDLLIDKAYRGQGIFNNLMEKALEHTEPIDALFALPNLNGKNAFDKLGWKSILKIDQLILETSINKNVLTEDNEHFAHFGFIYDDSIVKWRFVNSPVYDYYILNNNNNLGTVSKVFEDEQTGSRIGDIVYYNFKMNMKELKNCLLDAINGLKSRKVNTIAIWALDNTQAYHLLKQMNFKPVTQERYFCIKLLNDQFEMLVDTNKWILIQADAEIY